MSNLWVTDASTALNGSVATHDNTMYFAPVSLVATEEADAENAAGNNLRGGNRECERRREHHESR
jgi:hypothetical protein